MSAEYLSLRPTIFRPGGPPIKLESLDPAGQAARRVAVRPPRSSGRNGIPSDRISLPVPRPSGEWMRPLGVEAA